MSLLWMVTQDLLVSFELRVYPKQPLYPTRVGVRFVYILTLIDPGRLLLVVVLVVQDVIYK